MYQKTKKLIWVTLLPYLLYSSGLELNLQYLWGMPVSCKIICKFYIYESSYIFPLQLELLISVWSFALSLKHSLETIRGEGQLIVMAHIFVTSVLLLFPGIPRLFYCFCAVLRIPWLYFEDGSAENKSLSFSSSEDVLFPLHSVRIFSSYMQFQVDSSLSTWKMLCHFFLGSMIFDEKSEVIAMISVVGTVFLTNFKLCLWFSVVWLLWALA